MDWETDMREHRLGGVTERRDKVGKMRSRELGWQFEPYINEEININKHILNRLRQYYR